MPSPRINQEYENITHFLTLTIIEWIDVFTKQSFFDVIISSLKYCQKNKGLLLYEFVIMTNHVHLLVRAKEGNKLSQIISDFKKYTTREVLKLLNTNNRKYIISLFKNSFRIKTDYHNQIWMRENYPEPIFSQKFLDEKIKYIWNNPVKKGFVFKPEDWIYSSARNRMLKDNSIIKVDDLEN